MFVPLDNERRRAFADDGSITSHVKRSAGVFRIVVSVREAFEQVELGQVDRVNVGAARSDDHCVRGSAFNNSNGLTECQQRRSIAAGDCVVWTLSVVLDRDVTGRHVRKSLEQPQWCDFPESIFAPPSELDDIVSQAVRCGIDEIFRSTGNPPAAIDDSQPRRVNATDLKRCVLHGHRSGGHSKLYVARHHLDELFAVDVFFGIEIANLGSQLGRITAVGH